MRRSLFLFTLPLLITGCDIIPVQGDHQVAKFGLEAKDDGLGSPSTEPVRSSPSGLDLNRPTRLILQVDGGGIMGITPAVVVAEIEKHLRQRSDRSTRSLKEAFSLCVGTSTGSIIAGMCAAGVEGEKIAEYYKKDGYELFTKEAKVPLPVFPIFKYRYKRDVFQGRLVDVMKSSGVNPAITLNQMHGGPLLIIPAFDLRSNRTHFFRTRDPDGTTLDFNGEVQLLDAISASAFSAPLFFGKLPAPNVIWDWRQSDGTVIRQKGAVYNDGGQGTQNSAISISMVEGLLTGWGSGLQPDEQVVMISLGCGNNYKLRTFEEAKEMSGTKQATQFLLGNQARGEATLMQWALAETVAQQTKHFRFFRFDWPPDKKRDGTKTSAFSVNEKQRDLYIQEGEKIYKRDDFTALMNDLRRLNIVPSSDQPKPTVPMMSRDKVISL